MERVQRDRELQPERFLEWWGVRRRMWCSERRGWRHWGKEQKGQLCPNTRDGGPWTRVMSGDTWWSEGSPRDPGRRDGGQPARDWGAASVTFRPWSIKLARRMTASDCPHGERISPSTSTTPRRQKLNPWMSRGRELRPAWRRWVLPTSICSRMEQRMEAPREGVEVWWSSMEGGRLRGSPSQPGDTAAPSLLRRRRCWRLSGGWGRERDGPLLPW